METGASVSEMVERVARAICLARDTCEYCRTECLASPKEFAKSNKHALARAAIKAMREPTEAMELAGDRRWREVRGETIGVSLSEAYDAMIDEALK